MNPRDRCNTEHCPAVFDMDFLKEHTKYVLNVSQKYYFVDCFRAVEVSMGFDLLAEVVHIIS